jgi:hypothetical protein
MKKIIILLAMGLLIQQLLMAQNVGIGTATSGIWMEDYRDGTNRAFVGMQDSIRVGFYGAGIGGTG